MNATPSSGESPSRESYLDAWRGLAAMQVVLVHFLAAFYPYAVFGHKHGYPQIASWEADFFQFPMSFLSGGHAAVCMFFILSGYVLSYRWLGRRDYSAQRILRAGLRRPVRLAGVLLFTMLLGAVLWKVGLMFNTEAAQLSGSQPWLSQWWNEELTPARFFWDFTLAPFSNGVAYNPPLWTLTYELYGSFLVFSFLLVCGRWRFRLPVLLGLMFVFAGSLYQGFLLGIIVADMKKNVIPNAFARSGKRTIFVTAALAVLFCSYPNFLAQDQVQATIYGYLPQIDYIGGGYSMLGGLLFLLFLNMSASCQKMLSQSPTMQYLGRVSYATYALHFLVLGSLSSWLFVHLQTALGYGAAAGLSVLLSMPVILIAAHFVTVYVDRPSIVLAYRVAAASRIAQHWLVKARGSAAARYPGY